MAFGPHFWNLGGPQNFEKVMCVSHYSYNSFYIFRSVCRMIVILFRVCSATLEYTFEYFTCYHWTYENFFRAVSSQKVHERIAYAPHFWILERTPKFWKWCVFPLLQYFILYLPIYVSYGHDSFLIALCYAWAHFWIFILVSSDLSKNF